MDISKITLTAPQDEFVYNTSPYSLYSGGYGNGKTYALVIRALTLASQIEGSRGLLGRNTYGQLTESTITEFMQICPQDWIKQFHKKDMMVDLINGSRIYFRPVDAPEKLLSLNLTWFGLDQMEQIAKHSWNILISRLRQAEMPVQYGFGVCNPGSTHHWIYKDFYLSGSDQHMHIDAPSSANPYLPEGYVQLMRDTYPEELAKRYIDGEWGSFEGQIYSEFDPEHHVVEPFTIPDDWKVIVGMDHGYRNPTAFVFAAIDPELNVYIFNEHHMNNLRVSQHKEIVARMVKERLFFNGNVNGWVADPSIFNRTQEDGFQSIGSIYAEQPNSIVFMRGFNAKNAGIMKVKEYLKAGKIKFFRGMASQLIQEMVAYEWVAIKPLAEENPKEEAKNSHDHALDALRYLIYYVYENGEKTNSLYQSDDSYSFLGWQGPKGTLPIHDRSKSGYNVFSDDNHFPHVIDVDENFMDKNNISYYEEDDY